MSTDIQQPAWATDLRPSRQYWWRLWLLLTLVPLVAIIAFVLFQSTQVLPRLSLSPGYSLIDQDGKRLTNETMRGSLVIYNFTQTRCTTPCVETSLAFQELQHALAGVERGGIPLEFVTISYAPEHDTPEVLRAYADDLGADTNQWHFAGGDLTQIKNVMQQGFQTEVVPGQEGSFTVEPIFALVDGWGIVRAVYRTATPDAELLRHDLRSVMQEARNSTGANRYTYEAVHLFMCHNEIYQQP